ncbi:MAG: GTP-binding protein [Candidatus Lokiarchaeota archaeon]|nr:GTP-binding protein [Candidatus Lokiarchaeota archaeon]
MIDIILQVWDLGGQERFDFMKKEYFKGASVVALCFDLIRPESFKKLDYYLNEVRSIAGPIPILLIGNKTDLEKDVGVIIPPEDVHEWMRTHQITEFIKTSAKTGYNIDDAFQKLTILTLIDLKDEPKLGQYRKDGIFRFKVVLVGAGGVGKTSITHRFASGKFLEDYKLTIGVDFMTRKIEVSEDMLPEEAAKRVEEIRSTMGGVRPPRPRKELEKIKEEGLISESGIDTSEDQDMDAMVSFLSDSEAPEEEGGEKKVLEGEMEEELTKEISDEFITDDQIIDQPTTTADITEADIAEAPLKEPEPQPASPKMPPSPSLPAPQEKEPQSRKRVLQPPRKDRSSPFDGVPSGPPGAPSGPPGAPSGPPGAPPKPAAKPPVGGLGKPKKSDRKPKPTSGIATRAKYKGGKQESADISILSGEQKSATMDEIIKTEREEEQGKIKKKKEKAEKMKRKRSADKTKEEERITEKQDVTGETMEKEKQDVKMTKDKLLNRKTTVFYKKQMNPFTLNKLSVVLSTVEIYEQLKDTIVDAQRAVSKKTLKIKEISPFIQVEPYFPGCICVPGMIPLDAREESCTADFKITPLATGDIEGACVHLYYEGKLIDKVPTPTKVVKQTAAKISGALAGLVPTFGILFDNNIGDYLGNVIPLNIWDLIGGIEGFFMILSGLSALLGGIFYFLRKPKDAKPVEANFPEVAKFLKGQKAAKK